MKSPKMSQEIIIADINILIVSNLMRIKESITDNEVLSIGIDENGEEQFIYTDDLNMYDYMKIAGYDPTKINGDSPMEYWKPDDWCYFNCNDYIYGEPLYKSEIMAQMKKTVRDQLKLNH